MKSILEYPNELNWTTIKLQEILEGDKRLEASFYDIEARKARTLIKNCILEKKLFFNKDSGFIKEAFYLGRFKRVFVDCGEPIYQPTDITFFKPTTEKFISKKTKINFELLKLQENQIVITRSGSIGNCSIVSKTLAGKIFSDDLIRMIPMDVNDLGYIYAFIKTKIGKKLITTNNYGSVISHLEPEHLQSIQIPIPPIKFRNKIQQNILTAFKLRDESNDLLDQADKLLYKKLNIKPLNKLKSKYFEDNSTRNFSVKFNALNLRLDASYHLPIINEIMKQISKPGLEIMSIGDEKITQDIILPGRFKRVYVDSNHGVPFFGGKEILQFDPQDINFLSTKNHAKRIQNELTLRENMILVTCSGTIGNVMICPKYFDGWTASQHIIRIICSKQMNPGYIYAFLASDYGRELIIQHTHGSVVDEIEDKQVSTIKIPLPNGKIINEIGDLVLEANKKRTKAHDLEQSSIEKVKELIMTNQKS